MSPCLCKVRIYWNHFTKRQEQEIIFCPLHAAAEELQWALSEAPKPESEDVIAWLHNYSQWWHQERAKALAKASLPR